jgi:hypothetical protein
MDGFAGDVSEWPTCPGRQRLEYSIRRQLLEVRMQGMTWPTGWPEGGPTGASHYLLPDA